MISVASLEQKEKQRLPDVSRHVLLSMHACFAAKGPESAHTGFHRGLSQLKVSLAAEQRCYKADGAECTSCLWMPQ